MKRPLTIAERLSRIEHTLNLNEGMNWADIGDEMMKPAKPVEKEYGKVQSGYLAAVAGDMEDEKALTTTALTPNQAEVVAAVKDIIDPSENKEYKVNKNDGLELWDNDIQVRKHKTDQNLVVFKIEQTGAASKKKMEQFLSWIKIPDAPISAGSIKTMAFVDRKTLLAKLKKVKAGERDIAAEFVQRYKEQP